MFSRSFGLVFLAISLCVQAIPASNFAIRSAPVELQTSLTLTPSVIAKGFAKNGQQTIVDPGQTASLTSSNNFINFCATTKAPITNGQQITGGSCNPAPMGLIPSNNHMPSARFVSPRNLDTIPANKNFTVVMAIQNLATGNFTNPDANYFAAPQQLNHQGHIIGHSHFVIESLSSFNQTTPTDPTKFAFFKALNFAAINGKLNATVTGLPPGFYKMSSINTAANHQPVLVPIAQHGSLDDVIYFTVASDGHAAGSGGQSNPNKGASPPQASTTANHDNSHKSSPNPSTHPSGISPIRASTPSVACQ